MGPRRGRYERHRGRYGFGWLAEHAPECIRAEYAINEGGGGPTPVLDGLAYSIATGEKGRYEVHITFRGRATHAASPWHGDNVSFKPGEVLGRLRAWQPEIDVSHPYFAALAALLGRAEPVTPENVDALAGEVGRTNRGLGSALRGLSRMTLTPTLFSGGVKSNNIPALGRLVCDARLLPWQSEDDLRSQVQALLAGIEGVTFELVLTAAANGSPYDTPLSAAIRSVTAAAAGGRQDLRWLPALCTGFTDSRLVRPLGGVVYGFDPGHPDADLNHPSGVHGANESSELQGLLFRAKVYLGVALELLG